MTTTLAGGQVRPRFRFTVPGTPEATLERLIAAAAGPDSPCVPNAAGHHLDLSFPKSDRSIWSPHVHLEFHDDPAGTRVHGLIGPQPTTWTLYIFTAIHLATVLAFLGIYGFVQLSLKQTPWGLWAAAAALAGLVLLYAVSQIGKSLAAGQTSELIAVIERGLHVCIAHSDHGDPNLDQHTPDALGD